MNISAIIPVFNGERTIAANIAAIKNQIQTHGKLEIIVVDDGSQDSTANVLRTIDSIKVISQINRGPAAARNAGAREASGDILVFTDADTIPHADWLEELVAPFADPAIQACAGTYTIANSGNALAETVQKEIEMRHRSYGDFIKFAGTYNLAIRKQLFEKIGGFNETYTQASGEDNDLCYRILREGHEIRYVGSARVAHHHPVKLSKYLKEQFRHGYWRARLYRQFPERLSGDSYTSIKDGMEILLCLLSILAVFSGRSCLRRMLARISTMAAVLTCLWQWHYAGKLFDQTQPRLFTAGVFALRAFARTFGLLSGMIMHKPPVGEVCRHG